MSSLPLDASQSLARDLRRAIDKVSFAADCGLTALDDWQRRLLCSTSHRILGLCSRQSGKTTIVANRVLHRLVYDPGLALIVCPAERQSGEFFRAFMRQYRALDGAPKAIRETTLQLELENGSRIVALPGSGETIRSFSAPKTVVLDEAAFTTTDIIGAVVPMLATVPDGDLIAISNAGAAAGWFHEQWQSTEGWEKFRITADQCPRISAEYLARAQRELGPLIYAREFNCEFTSDDASIFDQALIGRIFTSEVKPLWSM